jgi:hypothetical protein
MQARTRLVARPLARLLLMQLGSALAAVLLVGLLYTGRRRSARQRYVFQWRSTSIYLTIDLRDAIRR